MIPMSDESWGLEEFVTCSEGRIGLVCRARPEDFLDPLRCSSEIWRVTGLQADGFVHLSSHLLENKMLGSSGPFNSWLRPPQKQMFVC